MRVVRGVLAVPVYLLAWLIAVPGVLAAAAGGGLLATARRMAGRPGRPSVPPGVYAVDAGQLAGEFDRSELARLMAVAGTPLPPNVRLVVDDRPVTPTIVR